MRPTLLSEQTAQSYLLIDVFLFFAPPGRAAPPHPALPTSDLPVAVCARATGLSALIGGTSSLQAFVTSLGVQLGALAQGQPGAQASLDGIACAGEAQLLCAQQLLRTPPLRDHAMLSGLLEQASGHMVEAAVQSSGQS